LVSVGRFCWVPGRPRGQGPRQLPRRLRRRAHHRLAGLGRQERPGLNGVAGRAAAVASAAASPAPQRCTSPSRTVPAGVRPELRFGDITRFRSAAAFASYAGTAPIEVSSVDVVHHLLSPAGGPPAQLLPAHHGP